MDILLVDVGGYCISGYWWLLMAIILVDILLVDILLVDIGGYSINGY